MTNTLKLIGLSLILLAVLLLIASLPGPSPEIFAEEHEEEAIADEIDAKIERDLEKLTTEELEYLIERQTQLEELIITEDIINSWKEFERMVLDYEKSAPFPRAESDRRIDAILAKQRDIDEKNLKLYNLLLPSPSPSPSPSPVPEPVETAKPELSEPEIPDSQDEPTKLEKPERPRPDNVARIFWNLRKDRSGQFYIPRPLEGGATPSDRLYWQIADLIKEFPEFSQYVTLVNMLSDTDETRFYKNLKIKAPAIYKYDKITGNYRLIPLDSDDIREMVEEAKEAREEFLRENKEYRDDLEEYIKSLPASPTPLPVETIRRPSPIDPFE